MNIRIDINVCRVCLQPSDTTLNLFEGDTLEKFLFTTLVQVILIFYYTMFNLFHNSLVYYIFFPIIKSYIHITFLTIFFADYLKKAVVFRDSFCHEAFCSERLQRINFLNNCLLILY